jgi:hypothetical protein
MPYDSDFRQKVRLKKPRLEIALLIKTLLDSHPDEENARQQSVSIASAYMKQLREELLLVKKTNSNIGALIMYFQRNLECTNTAEELLTQFKDKGGSCIPEDLECFIEETEPELSEALSCMKSYIGDCTADIGLLEEQSIEARTTLNAVNNIWIAKSKNKKVSLHADYEIFNTYISDYFADREKGRGATNVAPEPASDGGDAKDNQGGYGYTKATYAAAASAPEADAPAAQAKVPPASKLRWADHESSDEEEEDYSSLLKSFEKTGLSSKAFIEIPKDFEDQFPSINKMWRKLATKWNWDVKVSDATLFHEGFIGMGFGKAPDATKAQILDRMKDTDRVAMNTFVSYLLSVHYKPERLAATEHASLVSGFVTSLFLKANYKDSESNSNYLKLSLKNTDAGAAVIDARISQCFRTGSVCAKILTTSVRKMLDKIIAKASKDDLQSVLQHSDLCFTSYQGMMTNSFKNVSRRTVEIVDSADKRNKTKTKRRVVNRIGKDRPTLCTGELELTIKERELLRPIESRFNRLDEIAAEALQLEKVVKSLDPLKTAKVVKTIVDLAYDKIHSIRQINKDRRNAIRSKAQELAGEGKSVTTSEWMKAKKELIPSFEEIEKDIVLNLNWDMSKIEGAIQLIN